MSSTQVRVRFAPSPTGALHIGGVRTALYNYLFARQMGGKMLLRIEDTDQNRFVPGAEDYILEALQWVGITIDEGVGVGGPHAPYRQSERMHMYRDFAETLIAADKAYYAFDTTEELDEMRQTFEKQGSTFQYNSITRTRLKNSLTLPAEEVQARIAAGEPHVIRLKVPAKEEIRFRDLIRDWVNVHSSQIDDKVLLKADGMPTYHLANVVDDHLMEITHVIRGEEWLPSAPLHVLLYQAFGWERPEFAHLPLLLKPEGNGKLSKRDADLGGFPVFPLEWEDPASGVVARGFREDGYLPEAVINFLAFLGWNPGTEQEMFTMDELIAAFSLDKIHKGGARFDIAKAKWFNQQYLKQHSDASVAESLKESFAESSPEKIEKIVHLLKDRVTFPQEIVEQSKFLFEAPTQYDEQVMTTKWNADVAAVVEQYAKVLPEVEPFTAETAKEALHKVTDEKGIKLGKVMQPLRVVLTGAPAGPDLMLSMEIMGKAEVVDRLKKVL
ncbi:glutamate--tRNA ligase [Siphonobacter sp. SORGH_AS_0500]|uniref:glutamate--tRNA ligase n=1 Tax=Siphonobacter sp. SORGH_AS_0500 TaxID=1864824 RepID=UPI000CCB3112|nr:glutamate--tRNA ligase [Siphonobacter sp. SORGH_AS_0500]MDR6196220.1 glutamyl-tRNA synthetase [Siphonobacter sp. SORGH_AS_0500]PKK38162.1 glutamate--tRNA ligase [Siphonobacter sp. SORGH_AS_0500]